MRILVIGGAGYIGNEVCRQFDISGVKHTVFDNFLYFQKPPSYQNTTVIEGDIRNSASLAAIIEWHDVVVWLAAIVGEPACNVIPNDAIRINADSLSVLSQFKNKRVIFTSTASVYGIGDGLLTEKSDVAPLGIYGESKVKAERILQSTDHNVAICRLGTAFGIRPYTRKRFDLAVNAMTRDAIQSGVVRVYGGGRKRPFIHIQDIASAIVNLSTVNIDINGIFNISYSNIELIRLAELVAIETDSMIKCHEVDTADFRDYAISNTLAVQHQIIKSDNCMTLSNGITEVAEWCKANRNYAGVTTNFEALASRVK